MVGTRWLGVVLAALGWLSGSLVPAQSMGAPPHGRMALFVDAARQSGVPLPVLAGLAWEQSFLSDHGGTASIDGGYGLLGLTARSGHDTLHAAAKLVNADPGRLRRNDALNVLGGAMLLARFEREDAHRLPSAPDAWSAALVRFTGMRSRFAARLMLDDLFATLRRGLHAGGVRIPPIPDVRPDMGALGGLQTRLISPQVTESADYAEAVWQPASPHNFTPAKRPKGHRIRYIVIHDTEGSCASAVSTFQSAASAASAHYIVCLDGTVIQTVREKDIAWHAGNWPINQESIGIEHEGFAGKADYTRAQYLASAALVRYLLKKYDLPANRSVIFGHENVPAASHTDPGPTWNWSFYMQRVRRGGAGFAGGTTGVASIVAGTQVYACPKTSCTVLGSANWGEQYAIVGQRPNWEQIYYGGQTAWLPAASVAAGSGYLVKTTAAATLRLGPNVKDGAITVVPAGQQYVSMVRDGSYWYVAYNHRYGYIYAGAAQITKCSYGQVVGCLAPSGTALAVVPDAARAGMPVTVQGAGLAADQVVTLLAGDVPIGTAQTGDDGTLSTVVTLPTTLPSGTTTLTAADSTGTSVSAPLRVQAPARYAPKIALSLGTPKPGSHETVKGSGLPPEAAVTVTVSFALQSGLSRRIVLHTFTQPDGTLAPVRLTVPIAVLPGVYKIVNSAPGLLATTRLTIPGTILPTPVTSTPTPTPQPTEGVIETPTPTVTPTPVG